MSGKFNYHDFAALSAQLSDLERRVDELASATAKEFIKLAQTHLKMEEMLRLKQHEDLRELWQDVQELQSAVRALGVSK